MDGETAHSQGYGSKRAAEVVGISYRQLDYWARTKLITPSEAEASGSGSRRLYSYNDLLKLRVVKRMLDNGIGLEKVRVVFDYFRNELGEDISSANLVIDGTNVAIARSRDDMIDAIGRGQGVLPLSNIGREVDAAIIKLHAAAASTAEMDDEGEDEEGDAQVAVGES